MKGNIAEGGKKKKKEKKINEGQYEMLQQLQEAVLQLRSKLSENGSFHYLIDTYLVAPQANKLIYFQRLEQQDSKKQLLFPRGKKKNRALPSSPIPLPLHNALSTHRCRRRRATRNTLVHTVVILYNRAYTKMLFYRVLATRRRESIGNLRP